MEHLLDRITALAWPVFDRSARLLRMRAHPDWVEAVPNEVVVELPREPSNPDFVYAMPTEMSIFGTLVLDEAWLRGAERTGLLEVDGHFLLDYSELAADGKVRRVQALRLLPSAFPGEVELEYVPSIAAIEWDGVVPHLFWEEPDEAKAAVAWNATEGSAD